MKHRKFELHEPISTEDSSCPHCLSRNDGATGLETTNPKEGDVSICLYCAGISIFGKDLALLKPSRSTLAVILQDRQIRALQTAMREFILQTGIRSP
jgi:hypothetical protein